MFKNLYHFTPRKGISFINYDQSLVNFIENKKEQSLSVSTCIATHGNVSNNSWIQLLSIQVSVINALFFKGIYVRFKAIIIVF